MSWRDLLQKNEDTFVVLPWVGGRGLRLGARLWAILGRLPDQYGWHRFKIDGRKATLVGPEESAHLDHLQWRVTGYLVGDLLLKPDGSSERVLLLEPGLDRFTRVSAGRVSEDTALIYIQQEMPLGPEAEVQDAYLNGASTLDAVKGVDPSLMRAFKLASDIRAEVERQRQAILEQQAREAEERAREERRQEVMRRGGTAEARREMAAVDFEAAARAALAVGNAEYLDHRPSVQPGEMVVRFRTLNRRFECVCEQNSLRIVDSGICLTAHDDEDGFEYGTKGDRFFTLESLPSVIREADREGRLVVWRHA